jgi:hypothetical protein
MPAKEHTTDTTTIHRQDPLRDPGRFVTQLAQSAEHGLHTSGGKGGRGQRRNTRQHFCDHTKWRARQDGFRFHAEPLGMRSAPGHPLTSTPWTPTWRTEGTQRAGPASCLASTAPRRACRQGRGTRGRADGAVAKQRRAPSPLCAMMMASTALRMGHSTCYM